MRAGSVAGDIASKLTNKPGQVTFVGKNIVVPMSVSAQHDAPHRRWLHIEFVTQSKGKNVVKRATAPQPGPRAIAR